jgi:hypothetical protein
MKRQRPSYRSVSFLGESDVLTCIAHVQFAQNGIHGMRQRLIDSASRHYVAAQKKAHD